MLVDLRPRLDEPAVRDLLAQSDGNPTPAKLDALAAHYRATDDRPLLGVDTGHGLAGCIGLALGADGSAVVQHIAVAPAAQRQGLGRSLIESVAALYELTGLSAETDRDAVDFYRRCGFDVASLGEIYPGTERFRCTRAVGPPATRRQRAAALIVHLGRVVLLHRLNAGREYVRTPRRRHQAPGDAGRGLPARSARRDQSPRHTRAPAGRARQPWAHRALFPNRLPGREAPPG